MAFDIENLLFQKPFEAVKPAGVDSLWPRSCVLLTGQPELAPSSYTTGNKK